MDLSERIDCIEFIYRNMKEVAELRFPAYGSIYQRKQLALSQSCCWMKTTALGRIADLGIGTAASEVRDAIGMYNQIGDLVSHKITQKVYYLFLIAQGSISAHFVAASLRQEDQGYHQRNLQISHATNRTLRCTMRYSKKPA